MARHKGLSFYQKKRGISAGIVKEIAIVVEEGLHETTLGFLCHLLQGLSFSSIVHSAADIGAEHQGVVPESIELNDITRTRNDGMTVLAGVHPSDGLVATIGVNESVVVNIEIGVLSVNQSFHDVT